MTVVDPDSATLASAALVLNQAPNGTNESLAVDVTGTPIIANYNSANRTLSLAGVATVQQYQQVLRTATYRNLALSPNTTTRTVSFVVNDGQANSNIALTSIQFSIVATAPVVDLDGAASANFGYSTTFDRLSGPVNIAGRSPPFLTPVASFWHLERQHSCPLPTASPSRSPPTPPEP